jgi:hypothetical protein
MKFSLLSGAFALLLPIGGSLLAQTPCPSGDTVTNLALFIKTAPCLVGDGIVLYAPLTLQSSSMPVTQTHPNITTDDITILFGDLSTNPPTITLVAECANCAVTGMQATQIQIGAYFTGTFNNFGALMANWGPPPAATTTQPSSREYCMPFSELDAELGAGTAAEVEVVRTAATAEHNNPTAYVPGSVTFSTPQPITFNLMQSSFSCSYTVSYSATLYLSQPAANNSTAQRP